MGECLTTRYRCYARARRDTAALGCNAKTLCFHCCLIITFSFSRLCCVCLRCAESGNRLESVVSSSGILDGSVGDQGNILMRVGPLLGATKTTAPPNITSIVVPPSSARPTTPPLSSPASTAANNSSNAQPIYSGVVKTSNITITPSSVSSGSSATGKSHPCSPVLVKPSTTPPLRTASPNVPPLQHVKISEQPSTDTDHSGSGFYTTAPGTGGTVTGSDGGDGKCGNRIYLIIL